MLHQLVEKRKLQINTISLGKVTTDYIAHARNLSSVPVEEVTRFMYVASILILIKSKSLLPILEYTDEEEADTRALERRMRIFDRIRRRAMPLFRGGHRSFVVCPPPVQRKVSFVPDNSCSPAALRRAALSAIQEASFFKGPPKKKVAVTLRIEDAIDTVLRAVEERVTVSFKDLSSSAGKRETIVSFLAVLELMRKNLLMASQCRQFDAIVITRQSP